MNEHMQLYSPAKVWRRLVAIIYDAFIILALWVFVGFICFFLVTILNLASSDSPEDIANYLASSYIYPVLLFVVWFLYYAWSWKCTGQTLAMRAWTLCVIDEASAAYPNWKQCFLRFISGLLGLSSMYCFFNSKYLGLQDMASSTKVVLLPK